MNPTIFLSTADSTTEKPLEWAELWAAMRREPHKWVPTTEAMYLAMRECLPPIDMEYGGFLVGEANHHNYQGEAVYACFVSRHGYEARYMTRREFAQWRAIRT